LPQVTISIGIYTLEKNTHLSSKDIIKRADDAMYLSKKRGRNRTTVWGSGLLRKIELAGLKNT